MKKTCLTTMILVFLLYAHNGIQGQATQPQLDQLKLTQQYVGTWQLILNKDTTWIIESTLNGSIMLDNTYLIVRGSKSLVQVTLYPYLPKEKKFYGMAARQDGTYSTFTGSFEAKNRFVVNELQNFNPDKPVLKLEVLFESPKTIVTSYYNTDGVKIVEYKWTKAN